MNDRITSADLARILADCDRCPFDYDADSPEARVWRDLHRVAVALRDLRRRSEPLSAGQARTLARLVRRGLAVCGGVCAEVDGDGYTTADDVPWYAITAEGRASLALSAEGSGR